ncbi:MAG TPA: hypothetical protein VFS27_04570, partial [Blastocatellia bacterium]|nr:hypothetical protein [Blastocatellia bacterium]
MLFRAKAFQARLRKAPKENLLFRGRANLTTPVNPVNTCGHHRATVRNVTSPSGAAAYVCRDCFTRLRSVEVRIIEVGRVRSDLAKLFRLLAPGVIPGAALAA